MSSGYSQLSEKNRRLRTALHEAQMQASELRGRLKERENINRELKAIVHELGLVERLENVRQPEQAA